MMPYNALQLVIGLVIGQQCDAKQRVQCHLAKMLPSAAVSNANLKNTPTSIRGAAPAQLPALLTLRTPQNASERLPSAAASSASLKYTPTSIQGAAPAQLPALLTLRTPQHPSERLPLRSCPALPASSTSSRWTVLALSAMYSMVSGTVSQLWPHQRPQVPACLPPGRQL
jgi:hypothetical protein